jgi:hypothetical protein
MKRSTEDPEVTAVVSQVAAPAEPSSRRSNATDASSPRMSSSREKKSTNKEDVPPSPSLGSTREKKSAKEADAAAAAASPAGSRSEKKPSKEDLVTGSGLRSDKQASREDILVVAPASPTTPSRPRTGSSSLKDREQPGSPSIKRAKAKD